MAKRKVQKMRGKRTHGYGSKKKHRGGGSHGGRGYGGSHKHKYSLITTKEPNHFGYKGFHSLKKKLRIINLDQLEKIAEGKKEINLTELGYDKLLGRGSISTPLKIKVKFCSSSAKEKLEQAGGKIIQ